MGSPSAITGQFYHEETKPAVAAYLKMSHCRAEVLTFTGNPSTIHIPFARISPSVDWTHVKLVELLFTPPAAGDFAIGSLVAVPEPASLALVGLGALTPLRRGRRTMWNLGFQREMPMLRR